MDTPHWRALLKAKIQSCKNKLDNMAQKQTHQCGIQARQKEAREYLRDNKGPSKFGGKMHSVMPMKELAHDMPWDILWINQGATASTNDIIKKVQDEIPTAVIP